MIYYRSFGSGFGEKSPKYHQGRNQRVLNYLSPEPLSAKSVLLAELGKNCSPKRHRLRDRNGNAGRATAQRSNFHAN